jgi:hypothetical protein
MSTRATLSGPEKTFAIMACFSEDEQFFVAAFEPDDGEKNHFPPFPIVCWNLSTGQVENSVRDWRDQPTGIAEREDGVVVIQRYSGEPPLQCTKVEHHWNLDLDPERHCELSRDRRLVFVRNREYGSLMSNLLSRVGITWRGQFDAFLTGEFYGTSSGMPIGSFRVQEEERKHEYFHWTMDVEWSPGCETLAIFKSGLNNSWEIWDVPPRKSLTWFVAGAAFLALLIALLAWRRTRKLRAA